MTKALQEAIMKRTQLKQNIPKLKLKKAMLHLNLKNKEMFVFNFTKKKE